MLRNRARSAVLLGTALLVMLAAACGGGSGDEEVLETPAEDPTESAVPSETPTPTEGGIVLPTVAGGQFALNDVIGRPTMLWFWTPW